MVNYCKRVIIIKSTTEKVSGSAKLINENGTIKASVELISKSVNLDGYFWCLSGDNHVVIGETIDVYRYTLELDSKFTFLNGASFCICDLKGKKILCYGEYGTPCLRKNTVIEYLSTINFKDKKPEIEEIKSEYDDELIATENYYNREYEELLLEQIDDVKNKHKEETSKKETKDQPFSNEKGTCRVENYEYYKKVEDKLNAILKNHESVFSLNELIDGGEFVKINYDNSRCYFVGKIVKNSKPKYICYGIKERYGNCPEEFIKNAHFIPESEFDYEGFGYYFIFQNVHTGEIIV